MKPTSGFHVMIKPRGAICNLGCEYCYYLSKEKLYPGSRFHMSDELLEIYTRQYIESQPGPEVTFAWQGGEPTLMGLDFFRRALEYQEKYRRPGTRIMNTLQTNATRLDKQWCQFFKQHNFLVGVSLDGPPKLHNQYRKDKGGKPTFSRVMEGLNLLKKYQVEFNILACVHAANVAHPLKIYRFFRDRIGASFIQFIPVVERDNSNDFQEITRLTHWSVAGKQYGDFLTAIFDEWIQRDVGTVFVQLFDNTLAKWLNAPGGLCVFDETCGLALALEHNGDLYACDHFVEPNYRMGNITQTRLVDLANSPQQDMFGQRKRSTLPRYCLECEVRFACNGGCPKNRIARTPDGETGLNHLCEGYRAFFTHVSRPMTIMAELIRQRRPPSEVMYTLAQEKIIPRL